MTVVTEFENIADACESIDPAALIVAFASQEGDMVDQHFGSSQGFYTYAVTADEATLIAETHFGYEKKDGNEDKLKPKMKWLAGADVVYCGSVGGSATRQLVALGITPMQVKGGPDVDELIDAIQAQMKGTPEFWLRNILNQKSKEESSFDDDWDE